MKIASDSVNIELPSINLNTTNSTCAFEPIFENPFNLSASVRSRKVEDLEDILISKPGISSYCGANLHLYPPIFIFDYDNQSGYSFTTWFQNLKIRVFFKTLRPHKF